MKLYVKMGNADKLPGREQLEKVMWEKATSISHSLGLQDFNTLTLSWNKWIDDALLVDKRAFFRAAIYLAESTEGVISLDNQNWLSPAECIQHAKIYIANTFEEAVQISFEEIEN